MLRILQVSKDVRGPITDQVLTYACGKILRGLVDIAGIKARTHKLVNHTRTESTRNRENPNMSATIQTTCFLFFQASINLRFKRKRQAFPRES